MSRIVGLEAGATLGTGFATHEVIFASPASVMANWPPAECDLVLVPANLLAWARQVRQRETARHVPMLVIDWPGADRSQVYRAGVDGCLGHPADSSELGSLLAHLDLWTGPAYLPRVALENMGCQAIVDQVIEVFQAETPRLLEEVQLAFESRDRAQIARAAHRFGGGIAIFGPIPSLRACLALERSGERGHYMVFLQAVERLQEVLSALALSTN